MLLWKQRTIRSIAKSNRSFSYEFQISSDKMEIVSIPYTFSFFGLSFCLFYLMICKKQMKMSISFAGMIRKGSSSIFLLHSTQWNVRKRNVCLNLSETLAISFCSIHSIRLNTFQSNFNSTGIFIEPKI